MVVPVMVLHAEHVCRKPIVRPRWRLSNARGTDAFESGAARVVDAVRRPVGARPR